MLNGMCVVMYVLCVISLIYRSHIIEGMYGSHRSIALGATVYCMAAWRPSYTLKKIHTLMIFSESLILFGRFNSKILLCTSYLFMRLPARKQFCPTTLRFYFPRQYCHSRRREAANHHLPSCQNCSLPLHCLHDS